MSFFAGSVTATVKFDDKEWRNGVKRVKNSNTNLVKSFITAQLAVDNLKKIFRKTTEIVKESIQNAINYRETQNKFNVTFGDGTKVIKSAANAFKELHDNYGLSNQEAKALLSATGDLLTGFGFTKEKALELSESIQKISVDLASFQNLEGGAKQASEAITKAVLGETESAKALGVVIRQNTDEFRSNMKELIKTKGLTEQQARAQLILQQVYDQSKNAIGDYARTSMSLANMQRNIQSGFEDLSTSIGTLFLPIMRVFTEKTLNGVTALNKFLEEQKNLEGIQSIIGKIAVGFSVFSAILEDFGKTIFTEIGNSINELFTSFKKLFSQIEINIPVLEILSSIFKILGIGITVAIKLVKRNIQQWINWFNIIITTGKAIIAVFQAIADRTKWKEAQDSLLEIGTAYKKLGIDFVEDTTDMVKGVIEEFKEFPDGIGKSTTKYKEILTTTLNDVRNYFKNTNAEFLEEEERKNNELLDKDEELIEKRKKILEDWDSTQKKSILDSIKDINNRKDEFIQAGVEEEKASKWASQEIVQAWANQFNKVSSLATSLAGEIINSFQSVFNSIMGLQEQELEQLREKHAIELEELQIAKEDRLLNFDEETTRELEELALKEEQGTLTKEQAEAKRKEIEERRTKEKKELEKDLNKTIEEEKQKQLNKENEREKKIFEANKANSIAMVWIQAAIGIVGAWAQSISQLGPIAGSIFAAVLTTAILASAIAETVVISQQQFIPKREKGGMASGLTRVGEAGGEIITLPDGSQVIPHDISRQIAAESGGFNGNIIINNYFKGAIIDNSMNLKRIADNVSTELGRKLEVIL